MDAHHGSPASPTAAALAPHPGSPPGGQQQLLGKAVKLAGKQLTQRRNQLAFLHCRGSWGGQQAEELACEIAGLEGLMQQLLSGELQEGQPPGAGAAAAAQPTGSDQQADQLLQQQDLVLRAVQLCQAGLGSGAALQPAPGSQQASAAPAPELLQLQQALLAQTADAAAASPTWAALGSRVSSPSHGGFPEVQSCSPTPSLGSSPAEPSALAAMLAARPPGWQQGPAAFQQAAAPTPDMHSGHHRLFPGWQPGVGQQPAQRGVRQPGAGRALPRWQRGAPQPAIPPRAPDGVGKSPHPLPSEEILRMVGEWQRQGMLPGASEVAQQQQQPLWPALHVGTPHTGPWLTAPQPALMPAAAVFGAAAQGAPISGCPVDGILQLAGQQQQRLLRQQSGAGGEERAGTPPLPGRPERRSIDGGQQYGPVGGRPGAGPLQAAAAAMGAEASHGSGSRAVVPAPVAAVGSVDLEFTLWPAKPGAAKDTRSVLWPWESSAGSCGDDSSEGVEESAVEVGEG